MEKEVSFILDDIYDEDAEYFSITMGIGIKISPIKEKHQLKYNIFWKKR